MDFKTAFKQQLDSNPPMTTWFIRLHKTGNAHLTGTKLKEGDQHLFAVIDHPTPTQHHEKELMLTSVSSADEEFINANYTYENNNDRMFPYLTRKL